MPTSEGAYIMGATQFFGPYTTKNQIWDCLVKDKSSSEWINSL